MSPRRPDPRARVALIDVAARIVGDEGPKALTVRRVAREAGTSTMVIYTHFDGMNGLVREIVKEGFDRLEAYLTSVLWTDDPVADMALLGRAYRCNAMANSHLYSIMFGGASLNTFELTDEDRTSGRFVLRNVMECADRCVDAARFRAADTSLIAHQMWMAVHGLVTLEMGDYLVDLFGPDQCFDAQLVGLMIGAGDHPASAERSVALSRQRLAEEQASWPIEQVRRRAEVTDPATAVLLRIVKDEPA